MLALASLTALTAGASLGPGAQAEPQPSPDGAAGTPKPAPHQKTQDTPFAGDPPAAASGPTRIHVMAFEASDAIILESNGRFGFVDSGEDKSYPDGSDPRYPLRPGTTQWNDYEDILWPYLERIGVSSNNVDFYLGTHAHSDHIGLADKIIKRFRPKRIYTPEYSDAWITSPGRLWDNQFVYDKLIAAAQEAGREYGAALIQHLDPAAPLLPTAERPHTASPSFELGDLHIELMNYKEDYKRPPYVYDANLMAWGAKVSAFGQSAFLTADIENTNGDEDRLAPLVGQVDFLKLGHHGTSTSNSRRFLETLRPKVAFQTGSYSYMVDEAIEVFERLGTRWFPAKEVRAAGQDAYVVTFAPGGMSTSDLGQDVHVRSTGYGNKPARAFRDGLQVRQNGWVGYDGDWFWFEHSTDAAHGRWLRQGPAYYYLWDNGRMATGWVRDAGSWYYLQGNGAMATGWVHDAGTWYFLQGNGALATGWVNVAGTWYFLQSNGAMTTGWVHDAGTWYFLQDSGALATGWVHDAGTWYFLQGNGAMATGWVHDAGTWYFLQDSGALATGWVHDAGAWYFLQDSGALATGWVRDAGSWYFLQGNGAMATGWVQVAGAWYFLQDSGALATGWVRDAGSWYYLQGNGAMATGTVSIAGRRSRFSPSGTWLGYV